MSDKMQSKFNWVPVEAAENDHWKAINAVIYQRLSDQKYYFVDECYCDFCGPYATAEEAELACEEYCKTL